jgi:phosphate transport system ATP-binding protein
MNTIAIKAENFNHFFGQFQTLKNINLEVQRNEILGIIGPSGSGKSTFLRSLNRLNDLVPYSRVEGLLTIDGKNIYAAGTSITELRRKLGIVFATPVPLPRSIYENIIFGPKMAGIKDKITLDKIVRKSLEDTAIWEEVKDRLSTSALKLSGGQQQRLCIARILALKPDFILLDEPCSGLDPISTMKIEESLRMLKKDYTIIIVTNNTKQAARVADRTAFFLNGEMIEIGYTEKIFTVPKDQRTNDYISGRFG